MDRQLIARIIFNSPRLLEDKSAPAKLEEAVRRAYTYSGLHRNLDKDRFDAEVKVGVDAILYDIRSDRRHMSLRADEVKTAFLEGFRGTFGNDTTYLTPISFIRWIEAYMVHETRRSALEWANKEREKMPPNNEPVRSV